MLGTRAAKRDNEVLMVIAVALLAVSGLGLVFTAGSPRVIATVVICSVTVPIVLANWRLGPLVVMLVLPWYSEIRRVLLLLDSRVLNLDPMILIPDVIASLMLLRLILDYMKDPVAAKATWWSTRAERYLLWLVVEVSITALQPIGFNPLTRINGFRVFVLYMALYFFYKRYWLEWRWVIATCWATTIGGLVAGAYGVYQLTQGFPEWDQIFIDQTGAKFQAVGNQIKLFSTFQYTGQYSSYMWVCILVGLLALQLKRAPVLLKALVLVMIPLDLVGLANTFVRSSYVGLAVGVGVMLLAGLKNQRFRILIAVVGFIGFAAFTFGGRPPALSEDQQQSSVVQRATSINPNDTTFGYRVGAVVPAITATLRTGGFGYGLGASAAYRFGETEVASGSEIELLYTMVENGYAGFVLELAFFAFFFYQAYRKYLLAPDRDSSALGRMAIAVCAATFIASISGGLLHAPPGNIYFWLFACWVLNLDRFFPAPKQEVVRTPRRAGAMLAVRG